MDRNIWRIFKAGGWIGALVLPLIGFWVGALVGALLGAVYLFEGLGEIVETIVKTIKAFWKEYNK